MIGRGRRRRLVLSLTLRAAALLEIPALLRAKVSISVAIASIAAAPVSLFVVVAVALRRSSAARDEGGQGACILFAAAALLRVTLEIRLRLGLRRLRPMLLLRLMLLRLLLLRDRRAAGVGLRIRVARCRFVSVIPIVEFVVRTLIRRLRRLMRILLRELGLRGGDQAEVMLGVLQITFRRYRIARGLGVARELDVFFGNVVCRTAHLHVRAVRFVNAGKWIVPAIAIAAPHALLLLTVSHFRKSLCSAASSRLFRSRHPRSSKRHANPAFAELHFLSRATASRKCSMVVNSRVHSRPSASLSFRAPARTIAFCFAYR